MKKILFLCGGWDGHQPEKVVHLFANELTPHGFTPEISASLDILSDKEKLATFDVIFPCWTMGALTPEQSKGLIEAVRGGVALAGIHGGMGDAFRGNLDYEWMVGGLFLGHPHVGDYTVRITDRTSPITAGLPESFAYNSEQYYMAIDPAVHILAEANYVYEGRQCRMPVAWTRHWGAGRVFYSSLGHDPAEFTTFPEALQLTVRGILWATQSL